MKKFLFSRNRIWLGVVIGSFAVLPVGVAAADTPAPPGPPSSVCPGEQFSQPFLSFGDDHYYTLAPGQSDDNFDGTGWTLSGGASIVTTTLADGNTGQVLDLPAGSTAVSPAMCVSTGYPFGRMIDRVVAPPAGQPVPSDGNLPAPHVRFSVSSADGPDHERHINVPGGADWGMTHKVPVAPGDPGTEEVYFTFSAKDNSSEVQVYDLYVDPRMLH